MKSVIEIQFCNIFPQLGIIFRVDRNLALFDHFWPLFLLFSWQNPVSWVPNADGTSLVGHMVLHKSLKDNLGGGGSASSATILGLKVVGGKLLPNGRYGAVIEKVKKGSVADTVGHLLPGKMKFLTASYAQRFQKEALSLLLLFLAWNQKQNDLQMSKKWFKRNKKCLQIKIVVLCWVDSNLWSGR